MPPRRPKKGPPDEKEYSSMANVEKIVHLNTAQKKAAFILALKESYTIWTACKAVGIGARMTVYNWRKTDEVFAKEWDDALESAVDKLESSMFSRACEKDTLAGIFILKGARPEKYRERISNEHTGKGGGPIEIAAVREQVANLITGNAEVDPVEIETRDDRLALEAARRNR